MTQNNFTTLSLAEKIILVVYEMGQGKKVNLKYEDIVVAAFKKFPEDFHLRGYPEYPDSADLIHKPLYEFRKKGYLEANNKVFSLTNRGIGFVEQLIALVKGKPLKSDGRLSRFTEKEISRIESSEAFELFIKSQNTQITDTDFYTYLAVTPRTLKNDFIGRLETVEGAITELKAQKFLSLSRKSVVTYHSFMLEKFSEIIKHFKTN